MHEDKYIRRNFCLTYAIKENEIVSQTDISPSEVIFELTNGTRILYDMIDNYIIHVGYPELDHVTDEMWKREFTRRLKKMTAINGYFMKDLAERIGISEHMMSHYVTGKQIPNGYLIKRMSEELGCSIEYLTNFDYLL